MSGESASEITGLPCHYCGRGGKVKIYVVLAQHGEWEMQGVFSSLSIAVTWVLSDLSRWSDLGVEREVSQYAVIETDIDSNGPHDEFGSFNPLKPEQIVPFLTQ